MTRCLNWNIVCLLISCGRLLITIQPVGEGMMNVETMSTSNSSYLYFLERACMKYEECNSLENNWHKKNINYQQIVNDDYTSLETFKGNNELILHIVP